MRIKTSKGDLPVRYTWNTLRLIGDELDMTMNEMLKFDLMNRKIGDTFVFVYYGFVEGARIDGVECKVGGIEDVGDMLSENPSILEKAINAFADDMENVQAKESDDKKK